MRFFFNEDTISSELRGVQIRNYLPSGFLDSCKTDIYIKKGVGSYGANEKKVVDLVDSDLAVYKDSNVTGFIVFNDVAREYIERRTSKPIYVIPHHHCNFADLKRIDRDINIVGYVGYEDRLSLKVDILRRKLEKHGFVLNTCFVTKETSREDVIEAYLEMDINLVFDDSPAKVLFPPEIKCSLKVINASSFGIPTVGFRELAYRDVRMVEASNMYKIVVACLALRDKLVYNPMAEACIEEAKKFHIKEIAKKYVEYFGEK